MTDASRPPPVADLQSGLPVADSQGSLQAAVARTAARGLSLYLSRPVRLFRPSKVSGWHSLRGLATQDGTSLTPKYLSSLVKNQGFTVIPKQFFPPMLVNALLGTVLWASYSEASTVLQPYIGSHPTSMAALAGALAGGTQALVSAPAENVRLLMEGGTAGNSWSHAWKEVFRGSPPPLSSSRHETLEEIRKVRSWMKEVGDMAGRGWHGLGYTFGKDVTGFAAFFAIFEITRRIALRIKAFTHDATRSAKPKGSKKHLPQFAHGLTLVTGGVVAGLSYEVLGRPWDVARHAARLNVLSNQEYHSPVVLVTRKIREEGFLCLFRNPTTANASSSPVAGDWHRRIYGYPENTGSGWPMGSRLSRLLGVRLRFCPWFITRPVPCSCARRAMVAKWARPSS
ncbi:mitochondrial carrier domain-containing protein [Mycena metata]|uniref:Mitochondrial carrier domain-containing protein n=1 Tax=Mycena metata TaxID=1033252 RepID=A0AAD7JTY9_9AGAR|nr:mitochondrial carrier domain-containing protein [Mycena metata]